ncbi:leucine-rich_repeat domain-containing protein [Hexamita inflata]|uniref:Leucine-rich repeat domain-containing protein n=1 Tax=Hexamita inflata TaxID=28002 RepID=A0AA86NM56_9EUKA|nr:leucine-rich repeat domain-containing protein [Hexamita inflata]
MSVLMRRENTLIIEPGSDISKIQIINFILLPNSKKHFEGPPLQSKPYHEITSLKKLLNHFSSSQKLEICYLKQMKGLLALNVPPEIWKDASNRNLLSFNLEFVQRTNEFTSTYNYIQYIDLLSFLTNLTELNLLHNKISDISAISKIRTLETLDLSDNGIEDISTLQSLSDLMYLTEICLSENKISDISAISKIKNLKKLQLSSNGIQDISALQYLLDLTHLNLSENNLTTYTIALPNLLYLNISTQFIGKKYSNINKTLTKLQDISGLQHSPKLECLYLSETKTTDLSTIPHQMFRLKELILSQNNITQISYLSNFVDLQSLDLGCNKQIQNIGPLKFCTQLEKLVISQTNITDIWPLQFMKNLQTLDMSCTRVIDLHPLQYLHKLNSITAHNTGIIDVSPLSNLTQLYFLYLINNKITNVDTLKHHKKFLKYYLSDQNVPTTNELKFYNKILKVHSSHKQIRTIQNQNRIQKIRTSLTLKKNVVETIIYNYARKMNTQLEILAYFIESSNAQLQ